MSSQLSTGNTTAHTQSLFVWKLQVKEQEIMTPTVELFPSKAASLWLLKGNWKAFGVLRL